MSEENSIPRKSGRKIDRSIENPIDNLMIDISESLSPYFKQMNYTPNGITTLSLIFGLASLYSLYYHDVVLFGIYFLIAHFFDCMDGYYARKYGMVSEGGDAYDHYKDTVVFVFLVIILFTQYNITSFPILFLILCVMGVLGLMSIGCHEKITDKSNRFNNMKVYEVVTPDREKCMSYINYLKYFGPGTFMVVIVGAVIYLNSYTPDTGNSESIGYTTTSTYSISDNRMRDMLDLSRPFNGFGSVSTNPFL